MSYRCIDAFLFGDDVYPNGLEVADDAAILETHRGHFAKVDEPHQARAVEQASATPGGLRSKTAHKSPAKKAPAKAPATKEN